MSVRIGPARIADRTGTHEPGEDIDFPTPELLALAEAKTLDPETGEPYCTVIDPSAPAPSSRKAAAATEPAPEVV